MSRVTLRRVTRLQRGAGFPPEYQGHEEGDIPFFKVGDFNAHGNERFLRRCPNWISLATSAALSAVPVPAGTVLLPKIGAALLGNNRRVTTRSSVFDNNVLGVIPLGINPRYLYYLLTTVDAGRLANPGPIPSLDDSALLDVEVPFADQGSQQAVADYLDAETARIDGLIEKKQRLAASLEGAFRSYRWSEVAHHIVAHVPQAGLPTFVPGGGWQPVRLKYLVKSPVGGTWGSEPGEDEVNVSCYRVADFDRWLGVVVTDDPTVRSVTASTLGRLRVKSGDLLLEKSGGGDKNPVGFVVRVLDDDPAICSNFIARLRPVPEIDGRYLAHIFAALYDQSITAPFVKQTTGIQNLDVEAFLSQSWAIPPQQDQVAIRNAIDGVHQRVTMAISKLNTQVRLIREHRQALVTAAVTGEVPVPGVAA